MSELAIVFGASGAIGSELSRRLHARNFKILLAARRRDPLEALAREVDGHALVADATTAEDVAVVFRQAAELGAPVRAVANCVGSILLKPAHLTTDAEWFETLNQNLTSSFYILREAAKAMRKTGGSVALVSTAAALHGIANHEAIAAAKGGINAMVRSAAATYAPAGIRVNAVAPGLVESAMSERIVRNEASLRISLGMHALGRIGQAEDVASALAWLLDPEQSWVTGQILSVDGGLSSVLSRGAA